MICRARVVVPGTAFHCQFVFTVPKRLRIYFRFDRSLLGDMARCAGETLLQVYRTVLGRDDLVPGMIAGIQTFGELAHWHPPIHAIATDGAFTPDGRFLPLPSVANEPFLKLWQHKILKLLLAKGKITPAIVENLLSWKHSGFSVDKSVRIEAGKTEALEGLIQYIIRCPFSLDRMLRVGNDGQVIYHAEHSDPRVFPLSGSADLLGGTKRDYQVFEPLDFLAEITQHIPEPGQHLIRYYGWYSNKTRGVRAKAENANVEDREILLSPGGRGQGEKDSADSDSRKQCRQRWAALIKRVYEVDPLVCPRCGGSMRIISFIEKRQGDVIRKILTHCGLWEDPEAAERPSPAAANGMVAGELSYEPDPDFVPFADDPAEEFSG